MAAARVYTTEPTRSRWLKAAVFWSLLSLLPDADVLGFAVGVRYEDEWGHRGATHSFAFSIAVGLLVGLIASARGSRVTAARTAVLASLVVGSHAVLDTMTTGGLGCALFWPFDSTRYFAPWRPIPVAPIGLHFFSLSGLIVSIIEIVLFAPLFWFALRRRAPRRRQVWLAVKVLGGAVWVMVIWLLSSRDAIRDRVVSFMVRDDTEFTAGYSDELLRAVQIGETRGDIRDRLGVPFHELMFYEDGPDACVIVQLRDGVVLSATPAEECGQRGVRPTIADAVVQQVLGAPLETCWAYSRSPGRRFHRARAVCFENDRVSGVIRGWLRD